MRVCRDCHDDISMRAKQARRCGPCAKRKLHRRIVVQDRLCLDCKAAIAGTHPNTKRCGPCLATWRRAYKARFRRDAYPGSIAKREAAREKAERRRHPARSLEWRKGFAPSGVVFRPKSRPCGRCGRGFVTSLERRYFCLSCWSSTQKGQMPYEVEGREETP